MNDRERQHAVLHYKPYDRLPVLHFGFWGETLQKLADEGRFDPSLLQNCYDGSENEQKIASLLGFDHNYHRLIGGNCALSPGFQSRLVEEMPDGSRKVLNGDGVIVIEKPGAGSIPAEVDHTLKDRESFEHHFRHRLQFSPDRVRSFTPEEVEKLNSRDYPLGIHCGSLYGHFRNWAGVVGTSYMVADDEELFGEILDLVGNLCYRVTERILQSGIRFDFGHFWEDICFKNGPLVSPSVFRQYVGPHYKRITGLLSRYGIDIVSLDCDGMIDALIPTWFDNGVNTMFPIEVGTWDASLAPWRRQYGTNLRGVGGMNKVVFSRDYAAVDGEIERLKPLVELGGYIPCPDHRIPPDAKWENIQYYCDKMRKTFG